MNFLEGKKTYIGVFLIILHQGLKLLGVDIPQENLSIALDVILGIIIAISRYMAKPKPTNP